MVLVQFLEYALGSDPANGQTYTFAQIDTVEDGNGDSPLSAIVTQRAKLF